MTWLSIRSPSLLDTANVRPVEWWLVYADSTEPFWWDRWLKPGFRHVQAMRRDGQLWVCVVPYGEYVDVNIERTDHNPWELGTAQRVVALRHTGRLRSWFHIGPLTCVEQIKALLGIRSWWIRTPWQLYRYLRDAHEESQGASADSRREPATQAADRGTRAARRRGEHADEAPRTRPAGSVEPAWSPLGRARIAEWSDYDQRG